MDTRTPDRGLIALENGVATVDLSDQRVVAIDGADAVPWLDALVTTEITGLVPGQTDRTLLLSATGHLRADLTVVRTGDGLALLQDPSQPDPIGGLLAPYVLSAAVTLTEPDLAVFQVPRDPQLPGTLWAARPGLYGEGILIALPGAQRADAAQALASTFFPATLGDVERHRIRAGIARFPIDLGTTSIPAEAGWEATLVDVAKGCFPGQESVAKVRNLGHPPSLVLGLWIDRDVAAGDPVFEGGDRVGVVTSACPSTGGTNVIARIRWIDGGARNLSNGRGGLFRPVHPGSVRPSR